MFSPNQLIKCVRDINSRPLLKNNKFYRVAYHFANGELADKKGNRGGGVMLLDHRDRDGALVSPPNFYDASRFVAATTEEIAAYNPTNAREVVNVAVNVPANTTPAANNQSEINELNEKIEELQSDLYEANEDRDRAVADKEYYNEILSKIQSAMSNY